MSKQIELTLTKETKGTFVYASKEEVAKVALYANAAAVILAHNHPSGQPVPSAADKRITVRIKDALALLDIRVLDHIIVGDSCYSFAQEGVL
jgi:DNA repair protein RadC